MAAGSKYNWVWITGASSGLGEAMVYEFDKLGCNILLSSRNTKELERVKGACKGSGTKQILPLDLELVDQMEEKVAEALRISSNGIDLLINNGGISQRALAIESDMSVSRKIFEINFFGTIALTKAILPHFIQQKRGQIAVISSIVGKFGSAYRTSYSAAKHALHGYFESLKFEVKQHNIDITIICPGFIATSVSKNALTGDGSKQGTMDERTAAGMSVDEFGKKAVKAISKRKGEVYIGKFEIIAVYLKRYIPWLFFKVVSNTAVR